METQIILLILGVLFLVAGLFRNGAVIKKITEINKFTRTVITVLGLLLIFFSLSTLGILGNDLQQATGSLSTSESGYSLKNTESKSVKNSDINNSNSNTTEFSALQSVKVEQASQTPLPVPNSTTQFSSQTTNIRMASIKSPENFVTCSHVDEQNPENIGNTFSYGKVYAWAQVHAPREEVLTLKWYAPNNKLLKSKRITIGKNTGDGYRIYDYKLFHTGDDGLYELKLYNSARKLIGTRQFRIDGQLAGK